MSDPAQEVQNQSGSFVTGFTVGLFAGAAGYFLFATDRGEKVRQELQKEWKEAKDRVQAEGTVTEDHLEDIAETVVEAGQVVAKKGVKAAKGTATQVRQAIEEAIQNWLELDDEVEKKKSRSKRKTSKKTRKSRSKPSSSSGTVKTTASKKAPTSSKALSRTESATASRPKKFKGV